MENMSVSCALHQYHDTRRSDIWSYQTFTRMAPVTAVTSSVMFLSIFGFFGSGKTNLVFLKLSRGVKSGHQRAKNFKYAYSLLMCPTNALHLKHSLVLRELLLHVSVVKRQSSGSQPVPS
jgi:hypothetical protein